VNEMERNMNGSPSIKSRKTKTGQILHAKYLQTWLHYNTNAWDVYRPTACVKKYIYLIMAFKLRYGH